MFRKDGKRAKTFVYPQTLENFTQVFKMIRTQFTVWKARKDCEKLSRVSHGKYKCANCGNIVKRAERQYDHKEPVGETPKVPNDHRFLTDAHFLAVGKWFFRVFCNFNNLQCLCLICHKAKTAKELSKDEK